MDTMPFLHANQVFMLTFFEDLGFSEVRSILDQLLARDAFNPHVQQERGPYLIDVQGSAFKVWVAEMDVIIRRE